MRSTWWHSKTHMRMIKQQTCKNVLQTYMSFSEAIPPIQIKRECPSRKCPTDKTSLTAGTVERRLDDGSNPKWMK